MAGENDGAPATGGAQGARPAGAPESTPPASAAPATGASGTSPAGDEPLGPAGMAALAEEREARQRAERRARELEQAEQRRQREGQTELEQERSAREAAEGRARELEERLQSTAIRTAAYEAATKLGYRSPEVAYRLLDRDAIKFNEKSGQPENVESLLEKQLEKEPYLGKTQGAGDFGGGQRGASPPTAPGMNEALRAIVRGR